VKWDHLPDYSVSFTDDDFVDFTNRSLKVLDSKTPEQGMPRLDPEVYQDARIVAPGYDVHHLEQQWLNWWRESGRPVLYNPGEAFIGFCRARYAKNPNP
jgi:hypothetical protein